jgi:GAF domain-containing protein
VRGACRDVTAEQDRDVALAEARHRERSLIQLFRALRQAGDPKAAMEMGVATAAQATGAAGAMLCPVTDGEAGEAIAQFGSPVAAPHLARQAIEIRQPFRSLSAGRRLLALPGELGGRVAGVLMLWRPEDQPDWPDDDLFLLRELTDQLAVAIAQAEEQEALSRLSQTDALTGLLNRRGFRRGSRTWSPAKLTARRALVCRLDNFKQINDPTATPRRCRVARGLTAAGAFPPATWSRGWAVMKSPPGWIRSIAPRSAAGRNWRRRSWRCNALRRMRIIRSDSRSASVLLRPGGR